jgi:outer membrane protein
MKRSLGFWGISAAVAVVALGPPENAAAQTATPSSQQPPSAAQKPPAAPATASTPQPAVVSAQPGQRQPIEVPPPEADGVHITLDQAIRIALAGNEDLNVTINTAEATQFFLFQNMGIYDPLLTSNVTRAHTDAPQSSQLGGAAVLRNDTWDAGIGIQQLTPWGGTVQGGLVGSRDASNNSFATTNPALTAGLSLQISQPLLRNFGRLPTELNIETARNTRDASYETLIRSVQTVVNAVEQSYWDLVYARANLAVKIEARDIARELNRITKIKIDVGSLAPIDIVQTEVGIATAEQDIINAEAVVGLAEDQLRRNLNYQAATPTTTTIVPTDKLAVERQPFDLAEGVTTALQRRQEIAAQNSTVASNELRWEFWQNQTLPQLDLVAGYGKNGLGGTFLDTNVNPPLVIDRTNWWDAADQLFSENFKNWRVGLVFSYPILNRAAKGARGVAKYNLETSKSQLTVLEQDIVLDVRNAHRAIETAKLQIDAAAKGQELAERNLDAARKKYDNGMTTSFEVSQIQSQLSVAQSAYLNALALYRKAVSAYHNSIADILVWKGITIDGIPPRDATKPLPPIEARVAPLSTGLVAAP